MNAARLWIVAICCLVMYVGLLGCATQDSVDALEKRIKALEQKEKDKVTVEDDRQHKLENCVNVDADEEYWSYIRLNGKQVAGKPGEYTAAVYQWNEAAKRKKEKVEECKLLYGR